MPRDDMHDHSEMCQELMRWSKEQRAAQDTSIQDVLTRYEIPQEPFVEVITHLSMVYDGMLAKHGDHSIALAWLMTVSLLAGAHLGRKNML